MPNPTHSEFLTDITNDLVAYYTSAVTSTINGDYFIFYVNTTTQITQFKLSLYDRMLSYKDYSGVKTYFFNYITSFLIRASGGGGSSGFVGKKDNPGIII